MASTRDSVFYASQLAKYLQDNRKYQSPVQVIPFEMTSISATINDIYNLCVLPANCRVVGFDVVVSVTIGSFAPIIGDSGDTDRYMATGTALATANGHGVLANTGAGYTPTADTIVYVTCAGAGPTIGAKLTGYFLVIPGY
jgi:uncharacterized NAD(P)/FAD-binding protein YdhS